MTKIKSTLSLGAGGLAALAIAVGALVVPAQAADVGSAGDASNPATWSQIVQVGSSSKITISSDTASPSPATIPAVAGSAGGFGTVATQISVSTNDSNGSELTVAASGASADLSNGAGGSITAAGGTLTANKWGYTFVTGATNSAPTIGSSFSQMPASGSPATLFTDNNAAGTQEGFINYGAVVDYTLVAGANYETTVDFSAAIKP